MYGDELSWMLTAMLKSNESKPVNFTKAQDTMTRCKMEI